MSTNMLSNYPDKKITEDPYVKLYIDELMRLLRHRFHDGNSKYHIIFTGNTYNKCVKLTGNTYNKCVKFTDIFYTGFRDELSKYGVNIKEEVYKEDTNIHISINLDKTGLNVEFPAYDESRDNVFYVVTKRYDEYRYLHRFASIWTKPV